MRLELANEVRYSERAILQLLVRVALRYQMVLCFALLAGASACIRLPLFAAFLRDRDGHLNQWDQTMLVVVVHQGDLFTDFLDHRLEMLLGIDELLLRLW